MKLQKNDFIEIEFTGRVKGTGEIFDSNVKQDLAKITENVRNKPEAKPLAFALGQEMFVRGVDDFFIGSEFAPGESYKIELTPEKAFGKRNPSLVRIVPVRVFHEQNLNPQPGMMFNMDNLLARIISVSGGRVMTDFNNPLAGKEVVYNIKVLRKLDSTEEKIKAMMNFLFKQELKFEVDEKSKKVFIEAEKKLGEFLKIFNDKFKEILGLEIELKAKEENKAKNKIKEPKKPQ